ncbi:MAG: hypothetical protein LUC18_01110, partial [Porphyromonadaceae bacterium]|nr:hypothetical protein [Porphyromonadaceae bacterium]
FAELLQEGEKAFILLPGRHLLVENPFSQAPMALENFLFQLTLKDIHPIWAHPERYRYYHARRDIYTHIHDRGILFQVNLLSLAGYYGKEVKEIAWWLGQNGWIDLLGSDLHDTRQAQAITGWLSTSEYQRAVEMLRTLKNDLLFPSEEE